MCSAPPPLRDPCTVPASAPRGRLKRTATARLMRTAVATAIAAATAGSAAACSGGASGLAAEQRAPAPIAPAPTGAAQPPTGPPVQPSPSVTVSPSASPSASPTPISPTTAQLAMMHAITAVFENDKTAPQYAYIKDQHDDCGYTAGWLGFCTKYGDLLDVVKAYNTAAPSNGLQKYTVTLQHLADARTDKVTSLGKGFTKAWRKAADDPRFRQAQIQVGHASYLTPALGIAHSKGITTALGLENLFDTALMMGPSSTACDGVLKISAETDTALHGNPASGVAEADWLRRFNTIRIRRLKHPCTPGRKADWPKAVGRPQALQDLADAGDWDLHGPVHIGRGHDLTITNPAD